MKRTANSPPQPPPEAPQKLQGFLGNEEWGSLVARVDHLVREMERLPDPRVRKRVFELLQGIDALHREALHRLVRLFKEGVLEKVITDPAIRTLMELYDLLPPEADAAAKSAPAPQRFPNIPVRIERAPGPAAVPPPHWLPALRSAEAPPQGETLLQNLDGRDVLLCRVEQEWFALEAHCATDGASLAGARLSQYTLICPRHPGCFYDVRQGSRIGGSGSIPCLPVRLDEQGRVLVGFGMPFTPRLPSY